MSSIYVFEVGDTEVISLQALRDYFNGDGSKEFWGMVDGKVEWFDNIDNLDRYYIVWQLIDKDGENYKFKMIKTDLV